MKHTILRVFSCFSGSRAVVKGSVIPASLALSPSLFGSQSGLHSLGGYDGKSVRSLRHHVRLGGG